MPVVTLCSSFQRSREVAWEWALPWCEFVEGGCTGNSECVGHSCTFSQAAETMCSSLLRDPWPCYAGPLVKSRDYLKKKKKWGIYLASSCFLYPLHIGSRDRVPISALRTHCTKLRSMWSWFLIPLCHIFSHYHPTSALGASVQLLTFKKKIVSHVNMHLPWQWQPGAKPWPTWA